MCSILIVKTLKHNDIVLLNPYLKFRYISCKINNYRYNLKTKS